MYCYRCGKRIYGNPQKCPNCEANLKKMEYMLFENSLKDAMLLLQDVDYDKVPSFKIGDYTVTIPEKYQLLCLLNGFVNLIQENSWNIIKNWIKSNDFDVIVKSCSSKLTQLVDAVVADSWAFLDKLDMELDSEEMTKFRSLMLNGTDSLLGTNSICQYIYELAEPFEDMYYELEKAKQNVKTPRRSTWVGGGFGIRGALKGAAQASMLNLGGSLLNSVANTAKSQFVGARGAAQINRLKRAITESTEFMAEINNAWQSCMVTLCVILYDYISTIKKIVINEEDEYMSKMCLLDIDFTYQETDIETAISQLNSSPMNINAYINVYRHNPNYGAQLAKLAEYAGVIHTVQNAFLQYVDMDVIKQLTPEILKADISFSTLESLKNKIEIMEANNPIYSNNSDNESVKKVQSYSKKIKDAYNELIIPNAISVIRNHIAYPGLEETIREVTDPDNYFHSNIYAESLRVVVREMLLDETTKKDKKDKIKATLEKLSKKHIPLAEELSIWLNLPEPSGDIVNYSKYKLYADMGYPLFMVSLGLFLMERNYGFFKQDCFKKQGIAYLKLAARKKNKEASVFIGDCYLEGKHGFPKNITLAKQYYLNAAGFGDKSAKAKYDKLK